MPDENEGAEEKKVEIRDIEPAKDPTGGKRRTSDPCSGGE